MNPIARLVALAATGLSLALTAVPAAAEWCIVQEPTIFFYVCV